LALRNAFRQRVRIHLEMKHFIRSMACALVLLGAHSASAQPVLSPSEADRQEDLNNAHSILQKTTLVSIGVTGALGLVTAYNQATVFGKGQCSTDSGKPLFGKWGCDGLNVLHGIAGIATTGLFIATEVVAVSMPISPYDDASSSTKTDAMKTLRWINIGLVGVQGVMGLIAAYPQVIGIPVSARPAFSAILRTIHIGTGVTFAGTYTATAILQW
jgi:hypothetical protein